MPAPQFLSFTFPSSFYLLPFPTMQVRKQFPFATFEPAWQRHWQENSTFRAANPGEPGSEKPKFYALDMFPYPSGAGCMSAIPRATSPPTSCRATSA